MKRLVGILCCFVLSTAGYNQTQWDLGQCLDSALNNNLGLELADLNLQTANLGLRQARYDFTPELSGYTGHSYSFGRNLDPVSNEFTQSNRQNSSFSLSGNLLLFNGMSRYYGLKKNALSVENEGYNKKVAIRNLKMQIITSYLQALLSHELWRIAAGHIQYTNAEYEKMSALVRAETKATRDLLPIQAQKAKDELVLLQAKNDFALATLRLRQLMQLSNQTVFEIDTAFNLIFEDSTIYVNIESLPDVRQKEIALEQAQYNEKVAKSAYFPSLSMRAGIGSGYSDSYFLTDPTSGLLYVPNFQSQLSQNVYQSLTFSLSIPIYSQNHNKINQDQKRIETEKAELERQQLLWELKSMISSLERDIENAALELSSAVILIEFATLDFEQAEEQYKAGVINYTQLLDKKDRFFSAQSNVVQSKYNYYFQRKLLQLYNE